MRAFTGLILALGLAVAGPLASLRGAAQTAAAPQTPDTTKPVLTLNGDAAVITVLIKPDKTADFELVLAKLRQSLRESPKPERKAQAEGWSIFKCAQMAQGNVVYVMRIDPVVKGAEYDITRIIAEVFPVEVQEIFQKYKGAFAGRAIAELTRLEFSDN